MKFLKKIGGFIARVISRVINIKWLNLSLISQSSKEIKRQAKSIFTVEKSKHESESFTETCSRLNISEKQLLYKINSLYQLTWFFATSTLALVLYLLYNLFSGNILASMVNLGLCSATAGFTFKYHFWYFQMRKGKLGCSLSQWWDEGVLQAMTK